MRFTETVHGPAAEIDAPAGGLLVDVCDEARAPVGFSCRSARCATCLVEVLAGAEHLEPARPEERDRLARVGASPCARLACQAVLRAGDGTVTLRSAGAR